MVDEAAGRGIDHVPGLAMANGVPIGRNTTIADRVLTSRDAACSRLVRTFAPVPAHFHRGCDESIYILEGRGTVWLDDPRNEQPFAPGDIVFVARGVVHAMPRIFDGPVLSFSVDTPRRDPRDVVVVEASDRSFTSRSR